MNHDNWLEEENKYKGMAKVQCRNWNNMEERNTDYNVSETENLLHNGQRILPSSARTDKKSAIRLASQQLFRILASTVLQKPSSLILMWHIFYLNFWLQFCQGHCRTFFSHQKPWDTFLPYSMLVQPPVEQNNLLTIIRRLKIGHY